MTGHDQRSTTGPLTYHPLKDPLVQLEDLYRDILLPAFNQDELGGLNTVQQLVESDVAQVWAASDPDGRVLGMAIGEYDSELRIMLLSWLAMRPGFRGAGIGRPLLTAALQAWKTAYDPCLILAEVEDPTRHTGDELRGDPAARLRFYQRLGARPLDLPYFQAALGPQLRRVPDLLLMVLSGHPAFSGRNPDTVDGAVLRSYLEKYQRECEGSVADDPQAMRLWQKVDRPGGVPFRHL